MNGCRVVANPATISLMKNSLLYYNNAHVCSNKSMKCDTVNLFEKNKWMAKITCWFYNVLITVKILPAVCDGGQTGRTAQ